MDAARRELIGVLRDAVVLLARPGNDFAWSRWDDAREAIRDLNGLIASLESGQTPRRPDVSILFAPTGSIQEVSLSSGWAGDFLALAERFDAVEERFFGRRYEDGKGGYEIELLFKSKMTYRLLAAIGALVGLITGTMCMVIQTSGEHPDSETWLAIGWGIGASLALSLGVIARRQCPILGLICVTGGAFLWIAGFIMPAT